MIAISNRVLPLLKYRSLDVLKLRSLFNQSMYGYPVQINSMRGGISLRAIHMSGIAVIELARTSG